MTTTRLPALDAPTTTPRRPWHGYAIPAAVLAAIGGPFLLMLTNAVVNFTPDYASAIDAKDVLAVTVAHQGAMPWIIGLGLAACVVIVPGIWAAAARLARHSPWLAAIGGWLMASGYVLAVVLSFTTVVALAVGTSDVDPAAQVAVLDAISASPWMGMATAVFGIGALLGAVLLGVAMLRQRGELPVWVGILLIAAEPVRMVGLIVGLPIGPPLASAMITVAFGAVFLLRRPRPAA